MPDSDCSTDRFTLRRLRGSAAAHDEAPPSDGLPALAREGVPIVIGSRAAERAEEAARKLLERVPDAKVEGLTNDEAAQRGEIVLLCVPFRNQSENLTNLKNVLREGQILVDATVPLAAAIGGRPTRPLGVPPGSAGRPAPERAPGGVRGVSALATCRAPQSPHPD